MILRFMCNREMDTGSAYGVQWFEGMLLAPQHMQLSDFLMRSYAYSLLNMQSDFVYGLCDLEYNKADLLRGILRLQHVSGVFPDGLVFETKDDITYDLKNSGVEDNVTLYITLVRHECGASNCERFSSHMLHEYKDENTGQHVREVPILRPIVRIMQKHQITTHMHAMELAHIYKNSDGMICIDEFIGPRIGIGQEHAVFRMHHELMELIYSKRVQLRHKNSGIDSAEDAMCLRYLSNAYMLLDSITYVRKIHPFQVYQMWSSALSHLCCINPTSEYDIPRYSHDQIVQTFKEMFYMAEKAIAHLQIAYHTAKFILSAGVYKYDGDIKGDVLVGVKKSRTMPDDEFLHWIHGLQICSETMLPVVRQNRTLGAARKIISKTSAFMPPAGTVLLSITKDREYIKPHETLCLFHPIEHSDIEIVMYIHM